MFAIVVVAVVVILVLGAFFDGKFDHAPDQKRGQNKKNPEPIQLELPKGLT